MIVCRENRFLGSCCVFLRRIGNTKCCVRRPQYNGSILVLLAFSLFVGPVAANGIDYSVSVDGVGDPELRTAILETSQLTKEPARPVSTLRALRRRVESSQADIEALLRSRAYYAAAQSFKVEQDTNGTTRITLKVVPGPLYTIGRYDIRVTTPGEPREGINFPITDLGFRTDDIALSKIIVEADNRLLGIFRRKAYPFAKISDRRVVVDHKTRTLSVAIAADIGPYVKFGHARTEGLESVSPTLIARHVSWIPGTPFDAVALEMTRQKLRQTGLFESVLVRHVDSVNDKGELDIVVTVKERKHRSIGAGAAYSTSEGPLGKLFWEHRNLWGDGEQLRVSGEVGEIKQGVFGDLRINDFLKTDQNLIFDVRAAREQPNGFDSTEAVGIARLERSFSAIYAGSVGIGLDWADVDENGTKETFTFVTFPLTARRDTSDSLLDPSNGGRDTLTVTPNVGIFNTDVTFVAARLYDTRYLSLLSDKRLILAGWLRLGTLLGEDTFAIPANKRLFAGGAGSVRGYALNSIGPLDVQNDPTGGRSLTEFGAELRWRIHGPFGAVAFVEAGGVYDGSAPDWGKDLQWGAGVGARYLTKIGPLRLDVAVPLNRRNSVDDSFQILVSLGQAF